ncbi:hypothetical protein AKO1_010381, partial [Acrasis kona]
MDTISASSLYNMIISRRSDFIIIDSRKDIESYERNKIQSSVYFADDALKSYCARNKGKNKTIILYGEKDVHTFDTTSLNIPPNFIVKKLNSSFSDLESTNIGKLICTASSEQHFVRTSSNTIYPSEIIPDFLYLGSSDHSRNTEVLQQLGITHVLNLTCNDVQDSYTDSFVRKHIQITDLPSTEIIHHFSQAIDFIESCKSSGGKILIHCMMGISRSASFTIAYLMKSHGTMNLKQAYDYVKERRTMINPNPGFERQLRTYELQLYPHLAQSSLQEATRTK